MNQYGGQVWSSRRTAYQVFSIRERLEPTHFLWYILGEVGKCRRNNQWDKVLVQVKTRGVEIKSPGRGKTFCKAWKKRADDRPGY